MDLDDEVESSFKNTSIEIRPNTSFEIRPQSQYEYREAEENQLNANESKASPIGALYLDEYDDFLDGTY